MHPLIAKLVASRPIITDGAWGTQLQQRGLPLGTCPDLWNLSSPDEVGAVAQSYVEAGSRVILTNTFGSNRFILKRYGHDDRVAEINRAGVEISRRAAGNAAKVFASMGPSGVMLLMGEVTADQLEEAFTEQALAMAEAGADAIVIESMSDPAEVKAALAAAKTTGLPVVACMTFDSGAQKDRTMMGTTPEQAAAELSAAGADVVGANCGQGVAGFVNLCRRMKASTAAPIWIKANAGLPQIVEGMANYTTTPEEFAGYTAQIVDAGASFVGGCCGTSPDFIRALVKTL